MATIPPKKSLRPLADDELLISWEASQFHSYQMDYRWVAIVALVSLTLIGLFIILEHFQLLLVSPWLAGAVVIAAAATLITRSLAKPVTVEYGVTSEGILIGNQLMPFELFRSFSIIEFSDHTILRLWPVKRFSLPTSIMLDQVSLDDLKDIIGTVLPEDDRGETVSDQIARWIKF